MSMYLTVSQQAHAEKSIYNAQQLASYPHNCSHNHRYSLGTNLT